MVEAVIPQTLWDAFWAGVGGVVVGAIVLFILPLVERTFDITTGMTLIELRDPKQPLLRELQQRAPGTYNHSLNVATIAEAAASARRLRSIVRLTSWPQNTTPKNRTKATAPSNRV